jgi:hypothetical protein
VLCGPVAPVAKNGLRPFARDQVDHQRCDHSQRGDDDKVLVADGQGGNTEGGSELVEGIDQAVGAGAGGVVLAARAYRLYPPRSASRPVP